MQKFSEEQKRIALRLVAGAKTVEELAKELKLPYDTLNDQLKEMLTLKLVTKDGFPTKFSLKPEIVEELERRKKIEETDKNHIRVKAIIELLALEPQLLKKTTDTLIENLKKEQTFTVYAIKTSPVLKDGENYSSFLDLNFSAKDFRSIVRFMYFYGPISVEIIKPAKIELKTQDFQDGLMDMAEMIQAYVQYITKLMNREELENLHHRIITGK